MYTEEKMPKNVNDKCERHADEIPHFIIISSIVDSFTQVVKVYRYKNMFE